MAWTIPDKGEAQDNRQSILFQEHLDILLAGVRGLECVLDGCAVSAQGSPDMTVSVAVGEVLTGGVRLAITSGNATITTADATHPRIDLVVATSSATKAVRAGTPAAAPKPASKTGGDVVLAVVWVPAGDTTISPDQIVDMRVIREDLYDVRGLFVRIAGSSGAAGNWKTLQRLTSNATANSTTTPAAVMVTTEVGPGTWVARWNVIYQAGATTTGVGFQINHNGTVTKMVVTAQFATTGGAAANGIADQVTTDTANICEAKAQRNIGQKMGASLGVDTINADMHCIIEAVLVISANGTLQLMHYSEVAASTQVMSGTCLELTKIG